MSEGQGKTLEELTAKLRDAEGACLGLAQAFTETQQALAASQEDLTRVERERDIARAELASAQQELEQLRAELAHADAQAVLRAANRLGELRDHTGQEWPS